MSIVRSLGLLTVCFAAACVTSSEDDGTVSPSAMLDSVQLDPAGKSTAPGKNKPAPTATTTTTTTPPPPPPPTTCPQTYEAESITKSTGGAASGGWNIWSNGYVSTTRTFTAGTTAITVYAAGQSAGGVAPRMTVSVGGTTLGTTNVTASTYTAYTFTYAATDSTQEIRVTFDNDALVGTEDRNLLVDKIVVGCPGATTAPTPTPTPTTSLPTGEYATGTRFRAINRAGAEYGDDWDGWTGQTYFEWPSATAWANELTYLDSIGFNTVRIPISWERLQHRLSGPFNTTYQQNLINMVSAATSRGFYVIVDLHNYNRYATGTHVDDQSLAQSSNYVQRVFGDGVLTNAHVINVWQGLATLFKSNKRVMLELMNESHDFSVTSETYVSNLNDQIAAIRAVGATNLILAPNSRASDISHWFSYAPNGGSLDSVAMLGLRDSGANTMLAVHHYNGHTYPSPTNFVDNMKAITTWARTNGIKLWLTEYGVDPSQTYAPETVTNLQNFTNANADVWQGWASWNLQPYKVTGSSYTTDGTAMAWYRPYLTPGTASKSIAP